MKHFKDSENNIFAFESLIEQQKWHPGLTPITDEEAEELRAPPPLTPEQLLEAAKQERARFVDAIVVTVGDKQFDGNEDAQARMSRAIQVAEIAGINETTWVLANNVPTSVTVEELKQALVQAIQAMGAVWAKPYEADTEPEEAEAE